MKLTTKFLTIFILIFEPWPSASWAIPTTAYEAELMVTGWLRCDSDPLGAQLGKCVDSIEIFHDNTGEILYYIVNLDPSGFVIVSADDMIEPIIGFSSSGIYDPSPQNPVGALASKDLQSRIQMVRAKILNSPSRSKLMSLQLLASDYEETANQRKWKLFQSPGKIGNRNEMLELANSEIDDPRVSPLLDIEGISWGQQNLICGRSCFNYFTPRIVNSQIEWNPGDTANYACGCIPTSMAQLMRFHCYPEDPITRREVTVNVILNDDTTLTEQVQMMGGSGIDGRYDWDLMFPQHDCDTDNEAQRREIGALCFDAGLAAKTRYSADGSSTDTLNAKKALVNDFDFDNAIYGKLSEYNYQVCLIQMINPNLDAGMPIILSLYGYEDDERIGHSVVCDGYGYQATTLYHHLNLGWERSDRAVYDVWYNLPNVDTPSQSYTAVDECIYNIFPKGMGEIISGRVLHEDGRTWAGATVQAVSADGSDTRDVKTNSRGIYAFSSVLPNTAYTIAVQGSDYTVQRVKTGTSVDGCPMSGNLWAIDFPYEYVSQVLYVDVNATGASDGSSWADAFTDLQEAMTVAADVQNRVTEIWVAKGTYVPDKPPMQRRKRSFYLINGVGIYGGFSGWETVRQQRDSSNNETILSGDLNNDDMTSVHEDPQFHNYSRTDNAYKVVRSYGNNDTAILDGFTITGGNADGSNPYDNDWDEYGAGIHIYEASSPFLTACIFRDNVARQSGGAMYNEDRSSVTISECEFTANQARSGGAIFNSEESIPQINRCVFTDNIATQYTGGAVHNCKRSSATISECTFSRNTAVLSWGGAVCNCDDSIPMITNSKFFSNSAGASNGGAIANRIRSSSIISACEFTSNEASSGGAIYNADDSISQIGRCIFTDNIATEDTGGAIHNCKRCSATITDCTFSRNTAILGWGGAVFNNHDSIPTIIRSTFSDNKALERIGGAIYNNHGSSVRISECAFRTNEAKFGGAIFNDRDCNSNIHDSEFSDNRAIFSGGAVCLKDTTTFSNCVFIANSANQGGVINNNSGNMNATNCLFAKNRAVMHEMYEGYGGTIFNLGEDAPCHLNLRNCTLANNSATAYDNSIVCSSSDDQFPSTVNVSNCILWDENYQIVAYDQSTAEINFTTILGGKPAAMYSTSTWSLTWGIGNTSADPLFEDMHNDNYRLTEYSPCINAGDPEFVPISDEKDLDGMPRLSKGRIDMGAFEYNDEH